MYNELVATQRVDLDKILVQGGDDMKDHLRSIQELQWPSEVRHREFDGSQKDRIKQFHETVERLERGDAKVVLRKIFEQKGADPGDCNLMQVTHSFSLLFEMESRLC